MDYRIEPEVMHGQMTMFRVYASDGTKRGCWFTRERAEVEITELKNPTTTDAPATGWSNAAKRRATSVNSELGHGVSSGNGYTMYEGVEGSGRYNTQIWDES